MFSQMRAPNHEIGSLFASAIRAHATSNHAQTCIVFSQRHDKLELVANCRGNALHTPRRDVHFRLAVQQFCERFRFEHGWTDFFADPHARVQNVRRAVGHPLDPVSRQKVHVPRAAANQRFAVHEFPAPCVQHVAQQRGLASACVADDEHFAT